MRFPRPTFAAALAFAAIGAFSGPAAADPQFQGPALSALQARVNAAVQAAGGDASATMVRTASGLVPASLATLWSDMGRAALWGVKGDGVTDDTAAINAMLAATPDARLPPFSFRVTGPVKIPTGNKLSGLGRTRSILLVGTDFSPMSAPGVVQCGTAEPGCDVRDVGVTFAQPSTAIRANLVQYPPAFYAPNPRSVLRDLRISGAMSCIDGRGNDGGSWWTNIECGAFGKGFQLDGAFDFIHAWGLNLWPYGIVSDANLMSIYGDGNTVMAEIGRVDGLDALAWTSYQGTVRWTANAANATLTNQLSVLALDGDHANLQIAGGLIQLGSVYSTKGGPTDVPISITGGDTSIASLYYAGSTPNAPIQVAGGALAINGGRFNCNAPSVTCAQVSKGILTIRGVEAATLAGQAWTAPYYAQTGGALRVEGGYFGSPSGGVAASFAKDSALNVLNGPGLNGWTVGYPPTTTAGSYGPGAVQITGGNVNGLSSASVVDGAANGLGGTWTGGLSVGGAATSGQASGRIALHYDGTNNVGYLGAIAPGYVWEPVWMQAASFQMLSGGTTLGLAQDGGGRVGIGTASPAFPLDVVGQGRVQGGLIVGGQLKLPAYTVATLPACNAAGQDAVAVATDATSPTYRGALTGGGAVRTPVYCDGSSWTAH